MNKTTLGWFYSFSVALDIISHDQGDSAFFNVYLKSQSFTHYP